MSAQVLSGWGRFPKAASRVLQPRSAAEVAATSAISAGFIARGNGRAYGDAALGEQSTFEMGALDRVRAFDPETGLVSVEAGVLLSDLIDVFGPRGFFPMVTPGTRYVSVGGAIAADVHGKNHHRDGGFGDHVTAMTLATPDGEILRLSREENSALFAATVGGMGLTGIILDATFRLRRIETGWVRQRTVVAPDLSTAIQALEAAEGATYSVAWIDCLARGAQLGRSLVYIGEHARRDELDAAAARRPLPLPSPGRLNVPFDFPDLALNPLSVRLFNALYFAKGAAKTEEQLTPIGPYFFPLDGIRGWNRIYGRDGFVQHQCVLPPQTAESALGAILERIGWRGEGSFLAVLKKLGPSATGLMSFPMEGFTLALDFPMRPGLLAFLDDIDKVVVEAGGRLYLAKDARQSRATFEAGYPSLARFRDLRREVDPRSRIQSRLSSRLGL